MSKGFKNKLEESIGIVYGMDFSEVEKRVYAAMHPEIPHMEAIADSIRAARVASREMYTDGSITLEQYKNEKELQDKLVLDHIAWYKKMNLNFNELAFVGASGDGSAIF